ncbi:hypothetical protein RRG08_025998 [Elysia crispata]|uniref:Uncharacterized protein n=1 Tax=Elysia crispata TaxID=231223 RepID=A0AAE1B6B7_9GAST|nr:hypothetical protein RRG08_025998 [Elysia crispata]
MSIYKDEDPLSHVRCKERRFLLAAWHAPSIHRGLGVPQFKSAKKKSHKKTTSCLQTKRGQLCWSLDKWIRGLNTYAANITSYPILKKGKKWETFKSAVLPPVSTVKSAP